MPARITSFFEKIRDSPALHPDRAAFAPLYLFGQPGQRLQQALDTLLVVITRNFGVGTDTLTDSTRARPFADQGAAIAGRLVSRVPALGIFFHHDAHRLPSYVSNLVKPRKMVR